MRKSLLSLTVLRRVRRAAMVFGAAMLGFALIGASKAQPLYGVRSNRIETLTPSSKALPALAPIASAELLHDVQQASPVKSKSIDEKLIEDAAILAAAMIPARSIGVGRSRVMLMEVTAYCACKKCCGPKAIGLTASGKSVRYNGGRFVAADTDVLPFGTMLKIPGYAGGRPVEVVDRGSAIKGGRLDVYFSSHEAAKEFGRRWIAVTVVE